MDIDGFGCGRRVRLDGYWALEEKGLCKRDGKIRKKVESYGKVCRENNCPRGGDGYGIRVFFYELWTE